MLGFYYLVCIYYLVCARKEAAGTSAGSFMNAWFLCARKEYSDEEHATPEDHEGRVSRWSSRWGPHAPPAGVGAGGASFSCQSSMFQRYSPVSTCFAMHSDSG